MSNTKTLLKYFTNVKAVGKGSFGTVYIGNINIKNNVFSIAIKEGQISRFEANRAKKLQFPVEYLFNQMMNNILNNKCVLVLIIHIVYNFVIIVKLYQPF